MLVGFVLACCAAARGGDSAVVITEINPTPAAPGDSRWIELHVIGGLNVDLSGFELQGDIQYRFPEGTVLPGRGFLVVAENPAAANLGGVAALGPWTGTLAASGDVRIVNRDQRLMDEVDYKNGDGWPVGGGGATLAKRSVQSADESASAWTWSAGAGGTPGRQNFAEQGIDSTTTQLLDWTSSWRWRDTNSAPPADWAAAGFDDSGWAEGPGLLTAGSPALAGFSNLLGYWPVTETSGTTVGNTVAGAPAGVIQGTVTFRLSGTRGGQVLHFAGGGYVNAGDHFLPRLTASQDFTWAAWVNTNEKGTTHIILGNRYNAAGQESSPVEFVKLTNTAFEYYLNGVQRGITAPTLAVSSWNHHAVVKKGSLLTYYRNGVVVGTSTVDGDQASGQPFYFGGDGHDGNWSGDIDDVAVWGSALSAADIQKLSSQQATPPQIGVGTGTQLALESTAYYFRAAFDFHGDPARTRLKLKMLIDDGAVVYLNGQRIHAENMPDGTVTHGTLTSTAVQDPAPTDLLDLPGTGLVQGRNVIAVEVHQAQASGDPDMAFGMQLAAEETLPPPPDQSPGLVFNEISAATSPFQIELANLGSAPIDLTGYRVATSAGAVYTFAGGVLNPGEFLVLNAATLGFSPAKDDKLFLFGPADSLLDSRVVTNKLRGRGADGEWLFPTAATFGGANQIDLQSAIVINEIMYKQRPVSQSPYVESPEEWIELYNRSGSLVDLSGWKFSEGISYTFPDGTTLAPHEYLVIASDAAAMKAKWPAVAAKIIGNFSGGLSGKGERVTLEDARGNPADTVGYFDGGRWPEEADGDGSSLELRDPDADNDSPEAWAASDESARGSWQQFSWQGVAASSSGDPTQWNEFIFGLLDAGTFLIDDISVQQNGGANLIQNGGFEDGTTTAWRLLGTHRRGTVVNDPAGGGKVLRVEATGATEHMHNHAETTLKSGGSYHTINAASTYTISFRARWVSGNNQLNARLYFNRLAKTLTLPVADGGGTPGQPNSRRVDNIGPTYSDLKHSPAVPAAGAPVTVSVVAADPDGIGTLTLKYSVNEGSWVDTPMNLQDGRYTATIPGQAAGAKAQFYVEATDGQGTVAWFPAGGSSSKAMIPWEDGQAALTRNGVAPTNIRIVMPTSDANFLHDPTNVMSNDRMDATVIVDESDVYYGCGVKLKGSERGRDQASRLGFSIKFPSDHKLYGLHKTVSMDRSRIGDNLANIEILIKRSILHAGGIPGPEDDLCWVIAPQSRHTSMTILSKSRFDGDYLDGQYENGSDGTAHKMEYIYYPTTTTGGVEGLKYPEPDTVIGVPVASLGADKELYRWHWLLQNNEDKDDYSGMIPFLNLFGQSASWPASAEYYTNLEQSMDVEEWLRSFAIIVLFGVTDNYGHGDTHNAIFYQRPSDGRFLYFLDDFDYFVFATATTSTLAPSSDLQKIIRKPANKRIYYHALYDICQTTFNSTYLSPWAELYGKFSGTNMLSYMSYVDQRRAYVLSQIASEVPDQAFAVVTPSGASTEESSVTVAGTGWLDIAEIRLSGTTTALPVAWSDMTHWSTSLRVRPGANQYVLEAYDAEGNLLGSGTFSITGIGSTIPAAAGNLVVSELMYHPADATPAETAQGITDGEEFEYLEILNISNSKLDLTGVRFTAGITYDFAAGTMLMPGARLVLVRDRAAAELRYGAGLPYADGVYSGKLDNAGEQIALTAADGSDIARFTYDDSAPWPAEADGGGYSLTLIAPASNPDPSLAASWRLSCRPGGSPGGDDATVFAGDPSADDDGNGVSNFLQYATVGSAAYVAPAIRFEDGAVAFEYRRNLAAEDARVIAETSADLVHWTPVEDATSESPTGEGTVIVRGTIPAGPRGFFRIRAVAAP